MGKIVTSSYRRVSDHFEPDLVEDPAEQRKRRGHLEQIDYTVFAANQALKYLKESGMSRYSARNLPIRTKPAAQLFYG